MKKHRTIGIATCAAALLLLVIVKWQSYSNREPDTKPNETRVQRRSNSTQDRQVLTTTSGPQDDSEFFVYNNDDVNDFFRGSQFFGTMNKLGVNSSVMNVYPDEIADFKFIASKNSDREQFLASNGTTLTNENRKWLVEVDNAGIVGDAVRVSVIANVGSDVTENGGIRMGVEQVVCEIWKLDPIGNQPVLLDRSNEVFNGLATHTEVPASNLTWPEGIQFGTAQ